MFPKGVEGLRFAEAESRPLTRKVSVELVPREACMALVAHSAVQGPCSRAAEAERKTWFLQRQRPLS